MHESILRDFFDGRASAGDLRADLVGAVVQTAENVFTHKIVDMDADFEVTPDHLVRVCDAVLSGELEASELESIGYCLVASDCFSWDGDTQSGSRVAETAYDWSAPVNNYRLTSDTVRKFRERLMSGQDLFTTDDHAVKHEGH